ncbi:TonB-dependent receptor [Methylophaga sp.]|uniref:TonB-dependent receptor n=1 Tax=Methylophaga sp. TaxID=2024840 RepID=UPI003A8D824A
MAKKETKLGRSDFTSRVNSQKWVMSTLAMALSSAMTAPAFAEEVDLDTVVIEGDKSTAESNPYAEPDAPYKANRLSDNKRTRDIAETPQTMTVLTKESIIDSGKTELKDILSAQPGITLGTGEGGNSFGDRYIIRGYEARNDVFTDGLRDPGLITRETFALEQVEITKGPSSTFAGRGSTGGAVNSVTKKASLDDDFTTLSGGLGTDEYQRYTLDTNKVLSDDFAIRFNALYSEADVPDRDPAEKRRQGALLSAIYQPTDELSLTADYYHFRADDRTDPGVALDRDTNKILKYDYVGQDGLDFQHSKADIFTFGFDVELTEGMRLENKSRVGKTENEYIVTAYSARSAGTRSFTGWQENDYLGNQTNLIIDQNLWGKRHTIVTGIEFAKEEMDAGSYDVNPSSVAVDPYNPNNNVWSGTASRSDATTELELKTVSAYLMDTITLNDDWEVFAGVRYDYFDYDLWTAAGRSPEMDRSYSDGFWNGHAGVVFSPWENGNIYLSWSTSSNINGGEADAGGSCGYGGLCSDSDGNYKSADPEQSTNWELGTKWNLFDNNLLLTAAVFQTTKEDVIEGGVDSYNSGGTLNTGENRVRGIELGLSGNITERLSGQMGFAMMHSDTLDSYFDGTKEVTGRGGSISYPDNIGKPKANFAKRSFNGQLKYQATQKFAFGGVVTYSSGMFGGQPDAAANTDISIPGYIVYDAFASYEINDNMTVRANILNLFDKDYYTALYRGGSIVYKGDARSANVNLTYKF